EYALLERLPHRGTLRGLVPRELLDRLLDVGPKLFVGIRTTGEPDHREAPRQVMRQVQVVERGQQFTVRQIARDAEDDYHGRLGGALQPQPLAQGVCDYGRFE